MILRPFFPYYGSKWSLAKLYPAPAHARIIEPFAGSACYSLHHAERDVVLVERDPVIAELWRYLLRVTPAEVLALPDLKPEQTTDELDVEPAARSLIGLWSNRGTPGGRKRASSWASSPERARFFWGSRARARIARQLPAIRHWVVAHPPCARWGRYWSGGPTAKERRRLGDDGGCFAAALEAVRRWGGVLEHPEPSHAWRVFGLVAPDRFGGWTAAGDFRGWTCCVEQGHYGHRARKATWLYAVAPELPSLKWGPAAQGSRLDLGFHSRAERRAFYANSSECTGARKTELVDAWEQATGKKNFRRLTRTERLATPLPFRDVLLSIARSCR